ncbi:phosphatase PAP2 family protein [Sporomusa sp.]|uniref:phosphatase PAP2 family protein n=1 Tax=Sporomusa sp. TaxID=2078658 RepID=UPI002C105BEE|nr:phosphatase PAP2 family protein [Sporomusa sp.]HWR07455.1 phosphatase PAP2 family protein [Sporomusa sp.]
MNELLRYGLDIIVFVQQMRSPVADTVFRGVTLLGQEEFYLLVLPIILWCGDLRIGVRLSFVVLLSHYVNISIKDILAQPRPFAFRPEIQLFPAGGYSLPSNHAQTGLVFWLGLAKLSQKRYLWPMGASIAVCIGFSRIYLGVHFPTDVLAGWILGLVLLISCALAEPLLVNWIIRLRPWQQGLLALMGPILLFWLHPGKDSASIVAALSGAGIGLIIARHYVTAGGVVPQGEWAKLSGRVVVGLTGLFIIWAGLKIVFPHEKHAYFLLFRYIRYWLAGLWLTLGAPWLFNLLGLVPSGINTKKSGKNTLDNTKTIR